jgi:outer membrane protein TolC
MKLVPVSLFIGFLLCALAGRADEGDSATNQAGISLGISGLVKLVLQRNQTIQQRLLEVEASRHKYLAEKGIFEPEFSASADREVDIRQNNTEQASAADNITVLKETNDAYAGGLDTLISTGARIHLGYNLTDLRNNIPLIIPQINIPVPQGNQWQTFVGVTVSQPLLKNSGPAATMAEIRFAALSSKIAFQEYRQELMNLVSTTEATYWNLYLAQEQVRFFEDSVKTAQTILHDNRVRFEAGTGSDLEILEAQSGLGEREEKLEEARQKVVETANHICSLYAGVSPRDSVAIRATDFPDPGTRMPDYSEARQAVFDLNPDYLIQQEKAKQAGVRVGYAQNQLMPELNLKGAYGLNGLGDTPGSSWDNVSHGGFPSWSVGLEFRVPIGGGMKVRHELSAAELEAEAAGLALRSMQTEILNGMDTAWHKLQSARLNEARYEVAVKYNQSLLESALTRLEEGKIESRKVLEIEADLLESKNSVTESQVRDKIAMLELEVLEGSLLENRHLECNQRELESDTRRILARSYIPGPDEAQGIYQRTPRPNQSTPIEPVEKPVKQNLPTDHSEPDPGN